MPLNNVFYGVKMEYSVVMQWQHTNGFDHFVFQPAIHDLQVGKFTLVAYARQANLTVLNNGNVIDTKESDYNPFTGTKPDIQFANMKLFWQQVDGLYPAGGPKGPLFVYAVGNTDPNFKPYYNNTSYVQYVAWTQRGTEAGEPVAINPSPPHGT